MKAVKFLSAIQIITIVLTGCLSPAETIISEQDNIVNSLIVHVDKDKETIRPEIYGHFSEHLGRCIYEGYWVGPDSPIPNVRGIRTDVVKALKKINIPVLRWPGGCFADEYHWKEGIGPREKRPAMINTHWGQVTENNHFGTHEFLDLCEMLDCKPYISGNVGSGTVEEMQDWVEYITFDGNSEMAELRRKNGREKPWKVEYFGVGNENWGCGGNMTPEYYADLYKRFATYVRDYSGNNVKKIACGPGGEDYKWLETVVSKAARHMDAISLHHYVFEGDWSHKGKAIRFDEQGWFAVLKKTMHLDKMIQNSKKILDMYDQRGRIGLFVDEWGTWWDVEPGENPGFLYQQNTLRDAVVAGCFLNIFNKHCDRVKMANIAQTNNVLQAMILTKGDKMIVTPTYHVFEMYKVHHGAKMLPIDLTCNPYNNNSETLPSLSVSASKDDSGTIHISICNLDPQIPAELTCELKGCKPNKVSARLLTAEVMNAHNTFEQPNAIAPTELNGIDIQNDKVLVTIPSKSVVVMNID